MSSINGKIKTVLTSVAAIASIASATAAAANIDSPQGALDVAGVVPGKYQFLAKTEIEAAAPLPEPAHQAASAAQRSVTIDELLDIMRTATETAAVVREQERGRGIDEALSIAAFVPERKTPKKQAQAAPSKGADARALISARGFLWPVDGSIYSAFQATRGKRQHGAVDIVAPKGTPVAVAADGVVSVVANGGRNFSGYGKIVIVDHGSGVHTAYAHLDSFMVKIGQRVTRGEIIGTVGKTGSATSNLLHYEVRVDGKKIDPLLCMEHRPGVVKMVNYRSPKKRR